MDVFIPIPEICIQCCLEDLDIHPFLFSQDIAEAALSVINPHRISKRCLSLLHSDLEPLRNHSINFDVIRLQMACIISSFYSYYRSDGLPI